MDFLLALPGLISTAVLAWALLHLLDQQAEERAELLQRIQAPEQAVIEHQTAKYDGPEVVVPATEEEYWRDIAHKPVLVED